MVHISFILVINSRSVNNTSSSYSRFIRELILLCLYKRKSSIVLRRGIIIILYVSDTQINTVVTAIGYH